jgi:hypothetical protein
MGRMRGFYNEIRDAYEILARELEGKRQRGLGIRGRMILK